MKGDFVAKVLAIVVSSYTKADGTVHDQRQLLIFDPDGFIKSPSIAIDKDCFSKLKLNDIKEQEKYSGKVCLISCNISWSSKYGIMMSVIDLSIFNPVTK